MINMNRVHLFEFEDLSWFPDLFRRFQTDLLEYQLRFFDIYTPIVPKIKEIIQKTNSTQIVDLCSGSAGPLLQIYEQLSSQNKSFISIVLTDKYPHTDVFERIKHLSGSQVDFIPESVDATAVPSDILGFRTLFTSFHHFPPEIAKKIIQDAVKQNMPIGIFEFTERTLTNALKVILFGVILVFINTPFIQPFKWSRLFWTYLIPVVPLVYCWDSLVSHLRSYSTQELSELIDELDRNKYIWEIDKIKSGKSGFSITYLIGYPVIE